MMATTGGSGTRREDYLGPGGLWRPPRPEGLARVLAKAGYGSRGRAERMVREGRVVVDGVVVREPAFAADQDARIALDGRPLIEAPRRYLALHKPLLVDGRAGVDGLTRFLPPDATGLEALGRLDARSSGLVLLSNDHWWQTDVAGRRRLDREFEVAVEGVVRDMEVGIIQGGMYLQNLGHVRPLEVEILARDDRRTRLRLVMRAGKIRQIRRIFHSLRHEVALVHVVRVGCVRLGDLASGKTRPLTRAEVSNLRVG